MPIMFPIIEAITAVLLSCICLAASYHKLSDIEHFRRVLSDYAILPNMLLPLAAFVFPAAEVILGIGVLLPMVSGYAALLIGGLFFIYAVAMLTVLLRRKALKDCGCGGPAKQHVLSAWQVVRNLFLIAFALNLYLAASAGQARWSSIAAEYWLLVIPASIFTLLLYWVGEHLAANHTSLKNLGVRYG